MEMEAALSQQLPPPQLAWWPTEWSKLEMRWNLKRRNGTLRLLNLI